MLISMLNSIRRSIFIPKNKFQKISIRYTHDTRDKLKIQYVSDLHIDVRQKIPIITPQPDVKHLCICGDIGNFQESIVQDFLESIDKQYEKIFIVPGNHEYGNDCVYDPKTVADDTIKKICKMYKNIYFLSNSTYQLTEKTVIIGSILWSDLSKKANANDYTIHNLEFRKNVLFIKHAIMNAKIAKQNVIVMTHFVPTIKLIHPVYLVSPSIDFFVSDLEYLMASPVIAWICGHTHSVIDCHINGVYCGVNALGYSTDIVCYKYIYAE